MKALLTLAALILAGCATPRTGTAELHIDTDGPWEVRVFEHTIDDTAVSTLHQGDGPETLVYDRALFLSANAHTDGVELSVFDVIADGSSVKTGTGNFVYWYRVLPKTQALDTFSDW